LRLLCIFASSFFFLLLKSKIISSYPF